ncbi:MAG: nuclear transport factor 2 family protein, partial [Actinobacteria bacterium]
MTVIDKARTWKVVEERLAVEKDPHKRLLLEIVLEHMLA